MKCQKLKNDSQQCKAFAQKDKNFCFRHDPQQTRNAIIASQKGGKNRILKGVYGEAVTIESPEDIKMFLGIVINGVWSDSVPVQVGSSMGFLARCWLDAYEASTIVKRLNKIEKSISLNQNKLPVT